MNKYVSYGFKWLWISFAIAFSGILLSAIIGVVMWG